MAAPTVTWQSEHERLRCQCEVSDSYRCAQARRLNRIACQCECHRYIQKQQDAAQGPHDPAERLHLAIEKLKGYTIHDAGACDRSPHCVCGLGAATAELDAAMAALHPQGAGRGTASPKS